MTQTESTPLWLDLRKEYIDDNFDKLQSYLHRCKTTKTYDSFYQVSLNLYRERIKDLVNKLSEHKIYDEDDKPENHIFNIRLLAVYLLVEEDDSLSIPAYVALMGELRLYNAKKTDELLDNAINRLTHQKVVSLGYSWNDLENIETEIFIHKVVTLAKFEQPLTKPYLYFKYGTAMLSHKGFYFSYDSEEETKKLIKSGTNSIDTGIGLTLRTLPSQKLKQSLANSIAHMDEYVKDFILAMYKSKNTKSTVKLKQISVGQEVIVKITSIDNDGTIYAESVSPEYEKISGVLGFTMQSLLYYYTNTLYEYFKAGDCFMATMNDTNNPTFVLDKQFVEFLIENNKYVEQEEDNEFLCKLIDVNPNYYAWLNHYGVPIRTKNTKQFEKGQFALLSVDSYGKGDKYGIIYGSIKTITDESFIEKEIRYDCMRSFAEDVEEPIQKKEEKNELNPTIISLLLRQIFAHQKYIFNPTERYKYLCNALVMAELIGDSLSASFIKFASTYLRVLVHFVSNTDFHSLNLEPEDEYRDSKSTLIRLSVVELLKEYGRKDNSEILAKTIEDFKDSQPMLARLARLIQTANSMQGTLSDAAINVIRREIIKTLSLETENDADLESEGRTYLGVESGTQEFKTSMIFPSDNNMQPDEITQSNNVLKGVCAFLNSTSGGVLYLGVNDQGYVSGIDNDMKYLHYTTIDSYTRYIQDKAKIKLGIDSLPYIKIEPLYDNTVVAIHVEPHPYRVVELNGVAYLRLNNESREMPEKMRQNLIDSKMLTNKEEAAAISRLQHACSQKKCVKLHKYASSNSGTFSDRIVEAYNVLTEEGLIMGYDRTDSHNQKVKCFNISRIAYVEILDDMPWMYEQHHADVKIDAFHMTGDKPIKVSLVMDLLAKNLLIEEHPATKADINHDKKHPNTWYYNGTVFSIQAIARFYLGLADHIMILSSPELEEYVKNYTKDNFSKYLA